MKTLDACREKLKAGQSQDAYRELTLVFRDPALDEPTLVDAIGLMQQFSTMFGAHELTKKLAAVLASPRDPQKLYDGGYALYEERQFAPAVALLFAANRLAPGQPAIVAELSSCLEALLDYGQAALVIDLSGLAERDPVCAYLSGFNWLMSGDLEVPRRRAAQIANATEGPLPEMRASLLGMLARADALRGANIPVGELTLSAWQAVIDGTTLLYESPHGYEEAMRGRFAYVGDTIAVQRAGLDRLKRLCASESRTIARVVAAPSRGARILARAAATILGAPYVEWSASTPTDGSVVVAWTLEEVQDDPFLGAHQHHAGNQLLYVHASSWTEPFPYAPDVTTILHQTITSPYLGGALKRDDATRTVTPAAADTRDDAVIAADIVAATPDAESRSSVEHVLAIAKALRGAPGSGLHTTSGRRLRQRAGGGVPSNRFT